MKHTRFPNLAVLAALVVAALLPLASKAAPAQATLPTASQVAGQMTVGWNIGNTLEATGGETAWGNPMVTQQLIDSVKAAGFNTVRIPAAWDGHANQSTLEIDSAWLARVKQVVDYAINDGMYVILNEHWDGGWLEEHPLFSYQTAVNQKQSAYWTQIANYFKDYDEHLLFAGTNEVHADYSEPTSEHITVQQSYNQTFVNAVRATGGNNTTRTLVVQTYNTNMWHGLHYFSMPTDSASNRLIVEVHYYDPYDYTLNPSGSCLYWGAPYPAQGNCAWAQEAYVDDLFSQVRVKWVDAGIPVIIGEYGVVARSGLDLASRQYYLKYINTAAAANGMKTFYWDNGTSEFALFNRSTGAIVDQGALNAVMQGAIPCTTCTATPTRTPTRTSTITPTACTTCGSFAVSIKGSGTDNNQQTAFSFTIRNAGTSAVSGLEARIYFTLDGSNTASGYALEKYYDGSGAATVGAPVLASGTTYYFPVSFGSASLAAGAQWEIQSAMHLSSWGSTFNGANDWYHTGYAAGGLPASYAATSYLPIYVNGALAAGSAPGGTPVPSNTPTRTSSPTATTITSTRTATRTNTPTGTTVTPSRTQTRTNTPTFSLPDLVITGMAIQLETGNACYTSTSLGTRVSFSNTGSQPAGPFVVQIAFSDVVRQLTVSGLAAGATGSVWFPINGSATTTTGTIDSAGQVAESNETNNQLAQMLPIPTLPVPCTRTPTPTGVTLTPSPTPTRTSTPTATPTGNAACSPATVITVPFTFDGAGTRCWQISSLSFINSWNVANVSVNGVDFTGKWASPATLPAKINGNWTISYTGNFAWSHFEAR